MKTDLDIRVGTVGTPDELFIILQVLKKANHQVTRHHTRNCTNNKYGNQIWLQCDLITIKSDYN
jgi:hypothetical protein